MVLANEADGPVKNTPRRSFKWSRESDKGERVGQLQFDTHLYSRFTLACIVVYLGHIWALSVGGCGKTRVQCNMMVLFEKPSVWEQMIFQISMTILHTPKSIR